MAVGAGGEAPALRALPLSRASSRLLLPVLPKAELALELSPALFAVGFILGYRQAAVCVAGLDRLLARPDPADRLARRSTSARRSIPRATRLVADMGVGEIWSRYVRYIGAGAVATAGILTVIAQPADHGRVVRGGGERPAQTAAATGPRTGSGVTGCAAPTDRDLPGGFVFGGIATVVLVAWLVPGIFAGGMNLTQRAVCAAGVGLFGVLFVTVAARIVGIVGVSSQPTSGITLVTLLGVASVFAAAGWIDGGARAAVLTVGTIVAIAASKAGDISQDLKTGYLVGATPAKQQFGQLIGAAVACWAVAGTVLLLGNTYTFGGKELAAPQATLMKTIIEGVLSGNLPWDLVAHRRRRLDFGDALRRLRARLRDRRLPAALVDGLPLRRRRGAQALRKEGREKKEGHGDSDPGILAASGLVAGEGLAGIAIAVAAALRWIPKSAEPRLAGVSGEVATLVVTLAVLFFLHLAGRSGEKHDRR